VSDTWDAFPTAPPTRSTGGVVTIPGQNGAPTRVIMNMGDSPANESWDQFPAEKPTDYGGIVKQLGVGLAKGATGLAGLPGDLQNLAQKGVDYVKSKLPDDIHWPEPSEEGKKYAEKYGSSGDLGPSFPMPTSEDIQGAIEKVTGPWRKPQNQTEADAETGGEFVPAALAGPGSLIRKLFAQAFVPAAASITAGRLSNQNPYVKALAGFVAGVGGAVASGPSSVESIIRSKIPASVTEADITRAGQLIEHGQARGVTLTWPEALSRVTGQPVLTDTQRILESHGQTRAAMNDVLSPRAGQVERAARNEFDTSLGPASQNPSMIGPQAQQLAENTLNRMRAAINRATRPSYDAAGQTLVPVQVHGAMMADPLFEDAGVVGFLKEKRSIQAEVHLYVAIFLKGSFFKLCAKGDELYGLRLQSPGFIQIALLRRYPKVPENVQFISIIFVQEFGRQCQALLGSGAVVKRLFEDNGLFPGNTAYCKITNARTIGRERELLEHGKQPGEHFRLPEAGKPDT